MSRRSRSLFPHSWFPPSHFLRLLPRQPRSCIRSVWPRLPVLGLMILGLACERANNAVIDVSGDIPLLTSVVVSPSSINTDSINVGPNRQPEDTLHLKIAIVAQVRPPAGSQQSSSVLFSLFPGGSTTPLALGQLADDGSDPDQSRGDGTYSGWATFQIERVEIGTYQVEVTAEAQSGFRSNTLIVPLQIVRGNHPPLLSDLQAPDTIRLASHDQLLMLQVSASDPDGLGDIQRVLFNSYRPNGTPSSGNPFQMFDDGDDSHGDLTRGDGIYSLTIVLPSTSQIGTYRFEFQAFDRSNEGSNVIVHPITVTQ